MVDGFYLNIKCVTIQNYHQATSVKSTRSSLDGKQTLKDADEISAPPVRTARHMAATLLEHTPHSSCIRKQMPPRREKNKEIRRGGGGNQGDPRRERLRGRDRFDVFLLTATSKRR